MRPGVSSNESTESWRSPVPYLFGGVATLLGLITFALLVLTCSYWKLSGGGYVEGVENIEDMREKKGVEEMQEKQLRDLDEHFVVIMAGDDTKLFLANPIPTHASISAAVARVE